jgi:tyrosinase
MRLGSRLLLVVVCLFSLVPLAAQVRQRQNVDCLSSDQLNLYRKAMQILQGRDPKNDRNVDIEHKSYPFYARLHNGIGGVSYCTHGSELFLTWHRGLLAIFEKALQETSPADGTRDIRIPYWDWTANPTGKRYPAAFEVAGDTVLNHPERPTSGPSKKYTSSQIENVILNSPNWLKFGGEPGSGYGDLEEPYHNRMHGWIGGRMTSDTQAAVDPLFWSFHTYIDGVMARWQEKHPNEKLGCLDCDLDYLDGWKVSRVADVKSLGYEYDWTNCGPAAAPRTAAGGPKLAALAEDAERTMALGSWIKHAGQGPLVFDVTIPEDEAFGTADIRLDGAEVPSEFSYSGSVYLYPAEVALATGDATFRRRYRVGDFGIWGLSHDPKHGSHARETALHVDATIELRYIAKKYQGQKWKVAAVVEEVSPIPREGTATLTRSEMLSRIRFEGASIVLDRGGK